MHNKNVHSFIYLWGKIVIKLATLRFGTENVKTPIEKLPGIKCTFIQCTTWFQIKPVNRNCIANYLQKDIYKHR